MSTNKPNFSDTESDLVLASKEEINKAITDLKGMGAGDYSTRSISQLNDPVELSMTLANIAKTYALLKEYEKSEYYYRLATEAIKKEEDTQPGLPAIMALEYISRPSVPEARVTAIWVMVATFVLLVGDFVSRAFLKNNNTFNPEFVVLLSLLYYALLIYMGRIMMVVRRIVDKIRNKHL